MTGESYPAVAIVGPTASGKSGLALSLAAGLAGEIISCDALQVYRGFDIGTAKPSPAERAAVPHHMIDLREPWEDFSAGEYQRLAREALQGVCRRLRLPLVVGGTGLYLRALIDGFFSEPARSENLRDRMRRIVERKGAAYLHRILGRLDPVAASRIMKADAPRIVRALEIFWLTGKPMSYWHGQGRDRLEGFRWLKIGISWPRAELYQRIDARVDRMIQDGFIMEVRSLLDNAPLASGPFKALGYRQIARHLREGEDLRLAISETKQESRRYAKRQLTWFRSDPEIVWLDGSSGPDRLLEHALQLVKEFAGT